ncbi:MAG: LysR family transcriptional regulator [Pseudomonadota bacterium]
MRPNWYSLREFESLRALLATGTTSAAARRLGISQSVVSRAVASLEARLGQALFARQGNRLEPTAEAFALNENLDPLFDALARIDGTGGEDASGQRLTLAAPPTLAHRFLQARIAEFLTARPDAAVSLEICASDALAAGIAEARFELGVTDSRVDHSGVATRPFRRSRGMAVIPAGHALADRARLIPSDLDGQALIALTRRHSARGQTDRMLAQAGAVPRIVVETATVVSAWQFAAAGLGIALLNPFPAALSEDARVVLRPIDPALTYTTQFLTPARRPVSALARAFMRHVRLATPRDPYSEIATE